MQMEKSDASWDVQCIVGSPTHDRKFPFFVRGPELASEEPEHRDKQVGEKERLLILEESMRGLVRDYIDSSNHSPTTSVVQPRRSR